VIVPKGRLTIVQTEILKCELIFTRFSHTGLPIGSISVP